MTEVPLLDGLIMTAIVFAVLLLILFVSVTLVAGCLVALDRFLSRTESNGELDDD